MNPLPGLFTACDPRGRTTRRHYAIAGISLTALKFGLDRLIVLALGVDYWNWLNYWRPIEAYFHGVPLPGWAVPLLALALPFLAVGVLLTLRRLRDAGAPLPLVVLFFFPALNLVLFTLLCLLPSRGQPRPELPQQQGWLAWLVRVFAVTTPPVSAALALVLTGCLAAPMVWLATTFSELPPPTELIFRSGIAYPIRATLRGEGVGAVRHCEFSTGPFVEPITVWDENRHLAFDVSEQPHPMHELSPYRALRPAHLDGFFQSRRGEFRLTPLPNGGTRLEGTTWYAQRFWPAAYWRVWSDYLLHSIHRRVLEHIRTQAEPPGPAGAAGR